MKQQGICFMEKEGFVYIWYDNWRKMYYIGCHWGTVDDGYICSSNRMRDAHRRRPQDFKRRILQKGIKKESLFEQEYNWLRLIPNEELGKKYYNLNNHHCGHWSTSSNSNDVKQKISKPRKWSEATLNKIATEGHWLKGRSPSAESNKKRSDALKGIPRSEEIKRKISLANSIALKGNIPWNKGKPMSEAQKQKISETKRRLREQVNGQ
jgi:hypothetical protein